MKKIVIVVLTTMLVFSILPAVTIAPKEGKAIASENIEATMHLGASFSAGVTSIPLASAEQLDPPRLLWSFQTGGEVGSVAAIDDVNRDGFPDVLAGSMDGKAYCINGASGLLIWSYDTGGSLQLEAEAVKIFNISDVNNDGFSDAVAVRPHGNVFCIEGGGSKMGTIIWQENTFEVQSVVGGAILDFTGDGTQDIVVASCEGPGSSIQWINGSDGYLKRYSNVINNYWEEAIARIDDVDGGEKPDVLVGGTFWYDMSPYPSPDQAIVYCYASEGYDWTWEGLCSFQTGDSSHMRSLAVISSVNPSTDTIPDVLIGYEGTGSISDCVVCVDGTDGGEIWSQRQLPPVALRKGIASIGDVNKDSISDALAGTGPRAYCLKGDTGYVLWSFDTHGSESIVNGIEDVNYDGIPDAIVATNYPSSPKGIVRCIEGDSPLSALSLWTYKIENGQVLDLTSIDDINNDQIPDVIVGASDNNVYALSGIGASPKVDVFIRDSPWDDGSIPSSDVSENGWIHLSPDIWVTDTASNDIPNPVVNEDNLLYARVFNIGTDTAYNTEVNFYWADFGMGWPPTNWFQLPPTIIIPTLAAGSNIIVGPVTWKPYSWEGTKHRCIFVKLTNADDTDGSGWDSNLDNNIGWRNFAVEGLKSTIIDGSVFHIATVDLKVGNPGNVTSPVWINLFVENWPHNWTFELTSRDPCCFTRYADTKYVFPSMNPGEVGNVTLTVTAPEGTENDTSTITITGTIDNTPIGGITVQIAPVGLPTITSITPDHGNQGETLDVIITGTNFHGATELSFGAGITVNSFNVDSSTQITASVTIDQMCAHRPTTIFVTTPAGTATLKDGFTVELQKGCFIATAAYGTPMAQEIEVLRDFRDQYLLTNPAGEALVELYYKVSPPMAEFITEHPAIKPVVRVGLVPAVAMSTVVINTTPAEKMAIVGLLVLVSVAVCVTIRRRRGPEYT